MKTLSLFDLTKRAVDQEKMNAVRAGVGDCSGGSCCGCRYEGNGGSSTGENKSANGQDKKTVGFSAQEGFMNSCNYPGK